MDSVKILLICNESNSVINFRSELIRFLQRKSNEVAVIAGDDKRKKDIHDLGVDFHLVPFVNRSKNPFQAVRTKKAFQKVIREISPDLVMTFQIKPNILGAVAAYKAGVDNVYCMIEGLGDPFQPRNLKGKLIRLIVSKLYKKSLRYAKKVFVLNNDDRNELIQRRIAPPEKLVLIPGIGIDTSKYSPAYEMPKEKMVIKLARLIRNKGILEYCETARLVRKTRPDISFELYGEESELKVSDIQEFIDDGSIAFRGYCHNPADEMTKGRIIASSSYREGFPRVILEAMALGRVVVAYDVIGNRDAVTNGETGFLVKAHDIQAFADKIIEIIDNDELLVRMGKEARHVAETMYDSSIINQRIWDVVTGDLNGGGND